MQLAQVQNQLLENELRYQKQIKNFENEIDELHSRLAKGKSRTFTLTNKAGGPII